MSIWSYNTVFPVRGVPYAVYKTTADFSVSGKRLHPMDLTKVIDFSVDGSSINEEDRLVELYSEGEDFFFKRANAQSISEGLWLRFEYKPKEITDVNSISDKEVDRIASLKSLVVLRKNLDKFTARHPIARIYARAKELDRGVNFLGVLEEYLNKKV
jgi:hypothetical protein